MNFVCGRYLFCLGLYWLGLGSFGPYPEAGEPQAGSLFRWRLNLGVLSLRRLGP